MRLFFILLTFLFSIGSSFCQQPFILSLEQPEYDYISDVVEIGSQFYFLQNRHFNNEPFDSDCYSDLIITSTSGSIIGIYNLNGYRTQNYRILKITDEEIYLIGSLKSDSCHSKLIISKFNLNSHALDHLAYYDFCENIIQNIKIVNGLHQRIFIEGYHYTNGGFLRKFILNMDSTYALTSIMDHLAQQETLSVDFSRTGYVISTAKLYDFFDPDFNYRKQIYSNEDILGSNQTHKPFGINLIIEQIFKSYNYADGGIQVRLIDSNLIVKKKVIINPINFTGSVYLPVFGGIDIKNENEIWVTGMFGVQPNIDFSIYSITKLDSNLNIICEHFLGYDTWYIIFGISALESGGAIIYGDRVKDGLGQNEGEDIFAIRVGENCELPTTSTIGKQDPLLSISVYPNPGINDLTFDVNGFDPAALRVEMIDELGQVLFTITDLTNSIQIPELPAGQYFYRILQKDRLLGIGAWVKQ